MEDKSPIKIYGEKVLRQTCDDVVFPNGELNQVILSMFLIMYKTGGVGLAANQLGLSDRIAVINIDPSKSEEEQVILINPTITAQEGEVEADEGCLSIPGIYAPRKRFEKVTVENHDLEGNKYTFEADELLSVAVQHEIDHLNGKMYVDELDFMNKTLIENKLKRLARLTKKKNRG